MKNRRIDNIMLFIIINVILLFFVNIIENYYLLSSIYFYYILITTSIFIFYRRKISLLNVWNVAFLFIILSEAFIEKFTGNDKIDAIKYLINSNIIVNIFYIIANKKLDFKNIDVSKNFVPRHNKISLNILLLLVVVYFGMKIKKALLTFSLGRNIMLLNNDDANFFISILINPIGMLLPSVISYYVVIVRKKSLLLAFIYSLPIYIILFLEGTRFPLLFSLLGFGIVGLRNKLVKKLKLKDYLLIIMGFLILVFSNSLMKHFRNSNLKDTEVTLINSSNQNGLTTYLTSYMSPEGVIDMTDLSFKHFKNSEHMYGQSSSFILYFWVPRSVWPEKPTMLGHWLIRKYRTGFGDAHSSSFGFTGDLYADFGKFSYFFIMLFGIALSKLEAFKNKALLTGNYAIVIGAISYAFVFFFVRSPITSMMNFIGILFYYFLLKYIIFKQINATKNLQL